MRHCTKCIMPESYPGVSFDNEGVCDLCRNYKPYHRCFGKEQLIEVMNSRKRAGEYDCLVPISGGNDSTFCSIA